MPGLGTTGRQVLNSLVGDFQSNYLAAEQAYGAGDFETAQSISVELLNQLEPIPDEGAEWDAALAWRAFVALLAGYIDLSLIKLKGITSWCWPVTHRTHCWNLRSRDWNGSGAVVSR